MTNRKESKNVRSDVARIEALSGDEMRQYLVFILLKGNKTERLKGHIIPKRITASDANEAVERATKGKIFEEEDFEIIAIEEM